MRAAILRAVDRTGGTVLYLGTRLLLPLLQKDGSNKNIVVIKLWAIGESLLILPALSALHEKGYRITVVCTPQNHAVFAGQPFIHEVILFDMRKPRGFPAILKKLRRARASVVVDSDPFTKFSAVLAAFSGAHRRVGFANRRLLYTTRVPINEHQHAVQIFNQLFSAIEPLAVPSRLTPMQTAKTVFIPPRTVVFHAGSAHTAQTRRWPENQWAALGDRMHAKGWHVILVGSTEERDLNSRIRGQRTTFQDLSGQLTLQQLAEVLRHAHLAIATDSGVMHLAAAMGTPTIGLFGPNIPQRFGPFGLNRDHMKNIGLRKDTGPPCILPFRARFPTCRHPHLQNMTVEDVMTAIEDLT